MLAYPQLKWRCRRGTRELDLLLQRYLANHYKNASPQEKTSFEALLALEDIQLSSYLMGSETPPDPSLEQLVEKIRSTAQDLS